MKKLLFSMSIFFAITAYIGFVDDPLNSLISFLIAGSIPNTEIALGLWPSLGAAVIILVLTGRFARHIRYKILEHTAAQITEEKLKANFENKSGATFDKAKRSVIAARKVQVSPAPRA